MNLFCKSVFTGFVLVFAPCALTALLLAAPCAAEMADDESVAPLAARAAGKEALATSAPRAEKASLEPEKPTEIQELWTGKLYSSTYRAGVCFSAQGAVRGVVHLRLRNGQVDVYHIEGSVRNNEVRARHSSGHTFKGRLVSSDTVEGVISLKSGMKVQMEGRRAHNATLAAEDCAPPSP